ncbi:Thiamine biosynthesis lipoprotein ApbE precursor [Grimontia celer]|uniref:FAD:protein FMN transferase n=1 Tax=Grimontia celer TaxID=1796497 RepID=A0A128ET49_9GAMM|nr:FAD:protein FMN transferase [Grimontia celer]CZF77370.1 Thiamine biosynthesis lipoprotein ApbE precursor [Grimontia celer]
MKKFLLSVGLIISALLFLSGCEQAPQQTHITGSTMGTYYSVKYLADGNAPASNDIEAEIDARLELVNDQMSTYRKDSELSLFNQQTGSEPFTVSKDTAKVVVEAIRLNTLSDGALDVTVGPLVNLWGFGPEGRPDRVPTDEQIAERRAMTGIEFLSVDGNNLIKTNPGLYVDLSSIAKGFGVDVVANYLASLGIDNYLVEIGGELQLKGKNAEGQPWRIAIEKPTSEQQTVQEIIAPGDMAIATSGDYRNYFEENGVRYSHTINPATAKPINHRLVSVTVLDKSCMTADGLSTAFMVMGPDAALALANQENIPAFFIVKTDNGFNEVASDAFKPYLTR